MTRAGENDVCLRCKIFQKKLAVIGAGVAVLIAVLIYILFRSGTMPSASTGDASIRAGNEEERIAFYPNTAGMWQKTPSRWRKY